MGHLESRMETGEEEKYKGKEEHSSEDKTKNTVKSRM